MLTCITCSKQGVDDGIEEVACETPTTREAVKGLMARIKDIALKVSGAHKSSRSTNPSSCRRGPILHPNYDALSKGVRYHPGSSSSNLGDFPNNNHPTCQQDSRFTRAFVGDLTSGQHFTPAEVVIEDYDSQKEWTTQLEPGIQITLLSLPEGGNALKRIRFSRDLYDKLDAQRWWGENCNRIVDLYNVHRFNQQAIDTPPKYDNERDSSNLRLGATWDWARNCYGPSGDQGYFPTDLHEKDSGRHLNTRSSACSSGGENGELPSTLKITTSSQEEASVSMSNASEMEPEWIEEDEPGVYITIRQLANGKRDLQRVRFSRERFGEVHAKLWWEANKERIQAQYL